MNASMLLSGTSVGPMWKLCDTERSTFLGEQGRSFLISEGKVIRMVRGRSYRAFRASKKVASLKEAKCVTADRFNLPSFPLSAFPK